MMYSAKEGDEIIASKRCIGLKNEPDKDKLYLRIVEGSYKKPLILVIPPNSSHDENIVNRELLDLGISTWNFPGSEEIRVRVIICSNADEVELLVNGESYGRKDAGVRSDFLTLYEVVYLPGLIEVINYRNRMEFSREVLVSDNQRI